MQIKQGNNKMTVTGLSESHDIAIHAPNSGLMEMFMRDQIYTNAPAAVVRENLANAIDEHRKFNVVRPIEIQVDENGWAVRDFAKGLSESAVYNTFFTYCNSTKSEDDENMGGFGIGSKSGHSYTDRFFVSSFYGGFESVYVGIIETLNGMPKGKAHLVSRVESDEPTGIKITVPLNKGDFANFHSLSIAYASFAKVKIEINGEEQGSVVNSVCSGKNWEVLPTGHILHMDSIPGIRTAQNGGIVVGDIFYPSPKGLSERVIFRANIGDVDLALNKESLKRTDKTLATIERLQKELTDELPLLLEEKQKSDGYWARYETSCALPYALKRQLSSHHGFPPDPPYVRSRYSFADGKKAKERYKNLDKRVIVFHNIKKDANEVLTTPRGFWQSVGRELEKNPIDITKENKGLRETVETISHGTIYDWDSQESYDRAMKENLFWSLAPAYQRRLVSDLQITKAPRQAGGTMTSAGRPSWETFGSMRRKNANIYSNELPTITFGRYKTKESADATLQKGGYYLAVSRGRILETDFDSIAGEDAALFNTIKSFRKNNPDCEFVLCNKGVEKQFKKADNWFPLAKFVEEYITPDKIKKAVRSNWANRATNSNLTFGEHHYSDIAVIKLLDILSDAFSSKVKMWAKEEHEVALRLNSPFSLKGERSLKKIIQRKRKTLLTKCEKPLYSFVGATVLKNQIAQETSLKEIKTKLNT